MGGLAALIALIALVLAPSTGASSSRLGRHADPARARPAQAYPIEPTIAAVVSANQTGPAMPSGFVGLSLEYHALVPYAGRDPNALNPVFIALMRALSPGQPTVLRIGGDSTDQTWWPMPGVVAPGGINFSLTKDWLRVARAVAAKIDARLLLGVNMAADSPALAGAEGRALLQGIGSRYLDALEIGNEPDVYTEFAWFASPAGRVYYARPASYDLQDYFEDFARWRAALPTGVPVAGPAFATETWMSELPSFLSAEPGTSVVTFHRYPLRGCETNVQAGDYPSISNLLSDTSSEGLAQSIAPYVVTAHAAGIPFRLDELNSASCSGKLGVSNTFASALWVLDTLFSLASVDVDGVNIHTLPGAAYQPFSFTEQGSHWSASVKPLYYGLLMFEQAFPAGARQLSVDAPTGPVKVYATQTSSGQIHVVIINKDPITPVVVRVQLPGPQTPAQSEALSAPSVSSTSGVSLGGESFGASTTTGVLPTNPHPTTVSPTLGYYTVTLPGGSALMLTTTG